MIDGSPHAAPKSSNDPALAMSQLWQRDYDELNRLCTAASNHERAWFGATDAEKPKAERAYILARDARDNLMDKLEEMAHALSKTPALSPQGIGAKLTVAILQNAPAPNSSAPPWPMLRSCIEDLERLAANENKNAAT